jgi:hypothetical protein
LAKRNRFVGVYWAYGFYHMVCYEGLVMKLDHRVAHYQARLSNHRLIAEFWSSAYVRKGYILAPSRMKITYSSLQEWNQDLRQWYPEDSYRLEMTYTSS